MPQTIRVVSPVKGINRVVAREGQPPDTCWDALNMLPFDRFGRRRVAQRPGLTKQYATQISSTGDIVQGMLPVNDITYPVELNSTGLTFYDEPFITLPQFDNSWANVPSTYSINNHRLRVPANSTPTTGRPPITYKGTLPAGNWLKGTMKFSLNFALTGPTTSTAPGQANVFILFNYTGGGWASTVPNLVMLQIAATMNLVGTGTDFSCQSSKNGLATGQSADTALWAAGSTLPLVITFVGNGTSTGATMGFVLNGHASAPATITLPGNISSSTKPMIFAQTLHSGVLDIF